MKFTAPVALGTNTGASGATLAITTTAAVPAGATIIVIVTEKSTAGTNGSLADGASNTYSTITSGSLAALAADGRGMVFGVTNCKALANGSTITYTRNLSAASCAMTAFYVTGVTGAATFTEAAASATGTTGTITVTSGSLGAGRLVIGALMASGSSTAGGSATFTQATGGWLPSGGFEATTGGSAGSRTEGGYLFKAASGTQVYNPTLSSTAQQWFLAIFGLIPVPDAAEALDIPAPRNRAALPFDPPNLFLSTLALPIFAKTTLDLTARGRAAKPSDPPNLLLTTLAPPPVVINYIFRAPIFVKIPIPPKAAGEAVGTLNPLLTPNPAQPFIQTDWPRLKDPRKAVGEVFGTLSPLLTPNPTQPFKQTDWFQIRTVTKAKVDDVVNLLPNLPKPFLQNDWPSLVGTRKAKDYDFVNLLPVQTPVVVVVTYIFRSPLFTPIPATQKAKVDDFVRSLALFAPPPTTANIHSKPLLATPGRMLSIPGDGLPG